MTTITTCLWFDGNGLEAAEHYVSVIPGSRITNVSYYGPDQPGQAGAVMTVAFELAGQPFTALNGGPQYKFTEAVSMQVSAASQDEVDRYTEQLTADGGEVGPCGWVKDRFGLSWQVVPAVLMDLNTDPDQAKAARVFAAMLKMTKLDIATLEAAADKLMADDGYQEMVQKGQKYLLPGSVHDRLSQFVHPTEVDPNRHIEYVALVRSTILQGQMARGGAAGVDDLAGLHHVGVVGGLERGPGVLLDQQDRDPEALQRRHDVEDLAHDERREPEARLVEQQQAGLCHQRAAKRQHLLLAAGQRAGQLATAL